MEEAVCEGRQEPASGHSPASHSVPLGLSVAQVCQLLLSVLAATVHVAFSSRPGVPLISKAAVSGVGETPKSPWRKEPRASSLKCGSQLPTVAGSYKNRR